MSVQWACNVDHTHTHAHTSHGVYRKMPLAAAHSCMHGRPHYACCLGTSAEVGSNSMSANAKWFVRILERAADLAPRHGARCGPRNAMSHTETYKQTYMHTYTLAHLHTCAHRLSWTDTDREGYTHRHAPAHTHTRTQTPPQCENTQCAAHTTRSAGTHRTHSGSRSRLGYLLAHRSIGRGHGASFDS